MSEWIVRDVDRGNERPCDSRSEAEEVKADLADLGAEVEIIPPGENQTVQETPPHDHHGEPVDADGGTDVVEPTPDETPTENNDPPETPATPDIDALASNPIEWLQGVNDDYTNRIKGKDAISKRGFRYIQSQFGISTESQLVESFEDPLGVVVWARAELPDGRAAEAHGEGYYFESGVDDNEFVRYADTRAKNRALADLTSSGALCVEEMQGGTE